jgi:hypothetical protein
MLTCVRPSMSIRRSQIDDKLAALQIDMHQQNSAFEEQHVAAREAASAAFSTKIAELESELESDLELEEMLGIIDSDIAAIGGGGGAPANTFFLSHYQANGGDQARILHFRLDPHGGCWYDQTAWARGDEITRRGMVRGVLASRFFVLLLTKDVFTRWFCRLEIRTAMRLKKPILMVYESDARHADAYCGPPGREVSSYAAQAPPDMQRLFEGAEAVPFRRQELEQQAMVQRLLQQAGVAGASPATPRKERAMARHGVDEPEPEVEP